MASFMGIINFIIFIALIVLIIFNFITACINTVTANGVILCIYWLVCCLFAGIAPFRWIGITESLFKFMTTKIWRPLFLIFISINIVYWNINENQEWYLWVQDITGFIVLALGHCLSIQCCGLGESGQGF